MNLFLGVENAIEAMRNGAADYFMKPLAFDELLAKVKRILESGGLRIENKILRRVLDRKLGSLEMVGASPLLEEISKLIPAPGSEESVAIRSPAVVRSSLEAE